MMDAATQSLDESLINEFISCLTNSAPSTKRLYLLALRTMMQADIPVCTSCLYDFDLWLHRAGMSVSTRRIYISGVRRLISWLVATGRFTGYDYFRSEAMLSAIRGRGRVTRPLPQAHPKTPKLIEYFDSLPMPEPCAVVHGVGSERHKIMLELLRNRALIHTLFSTAARIGETLSLTRASVQDGRASEATLTAEATKTRRARIVFLSPSAQAAIGNYCARRSDDCVALFCVHRGLSERPMAVAAAQVVIRQAGRKIGIQNCHPHMIRHFVASELRVRGWQLADIAAFLGHTSLQTTATIYAALPTPTLRRLVDAYHGGFPRDVVQLPLL